MTDKIFLKNRKANLILLWAISEKWFRILEYSLIMGVLYFAKQKIDFIIIDIVYYVSWIVYFLVFIEAAEFAAQQYYFEKEVKNNFVRWIAWIFSMFMFLIFFFLIIHTGEIITDTLNRAL